MKIKCIKDKLIKGQDDQRLVEWANGQELEITLGKIYVVLAIYKYQDVLYYYILGDESINYPLSFPIELFEIIDNKISQYWDCDFQFLESFEKLPLENDDVLSFKEWSIKKSEFYEKLLEEDNNTITIFRAKRDLMLKESHVPN